MSDIDDNIAALREAMASGALKVRTKTEGVEKEIWYRSYAEMRQALADLVEQRDGPRSRRTLAGFRSGA